MLRDEEIPTSIMKVLVIGDKDSGKSNLILRYADNAFTESFISTIGVDFKVKTVETDDDIVKIQIWDDPQKHKFYKNYSGAHAIIITIDMSKQHSITSLQEYLYDLDRYAYENVIRVIVGTKIDEKNEITKENIEMLKYFFDAFSPKNSEDNRMMLGFVSSKTNENINELFNAIASKFISNQPQKQLQSPQEIERAKQKLIERLKTLCGDQEFWSDKIKNPTTIIPDGVKSIGIILSGKKKQFKRYFATN